MITAFSISMVIMVTLLAGLVLLRKAMISISSRYDRAVFDKRNQHYGAFQLRKWYIWHLYKGATYAILITLSLLLLAYYWYQSVTPRAEYVSNYKTAEYHNTELEIPRLPLPEKSTKAPKPKSTKSPAVSTQDPLTTNKVDTPSVVADSTALPSNVADTLGIASTTLPGQGGVSSDTSGTQWYTEEIVMQAERDARFPGGSDSLRAYVYRHTSWPEYALTHQVNGILYVHLVVNTDGTLEDIRLYKGIESTVNEDILKILKNSPNWEPALFKGKFVRQRLIVPIYYDTRERATYK